MHVSFTGLGLFKTHYCLFLEPFTLNSFKPGLDSLVFQVNGNETHIEIDEVYTIKKGPFIKRTVAKFEESNGTWYHPESIWQRRSDLMVSQLIHETVNPLNFLVGAFFQQGTELTGYYVRFGRKYKLFYDEGNKTSKSNANISFQHLLVKQEH